jgi:hypothetical protein
MGGFMIQNGTCNQITFEKWKVDESQVVHTEVVTETFDDVVEYMNRTFARYRPIQSSDPEHVLAVVRSFAGQILSIDWEGHHWRHGSE